VTVKAAGADPEQTFCEMFEAIVPGVGVPVHGVGGVQVKVKPVEGKAAGEVEVNRTL
jgi:hypothetical protein